ncbi:MAG: FAD-dependent thymidylate synthase [Nanoarchaeota archaeon]|nr:FAD-dependent thymidylate synthase [Nanoarchaeota archaeon]
MQIIEPSFEIMDWEDPIKHIERCGRVCYKSEDKITDTSAEKFVEMLIKKGHLSVLEHASCVIHKFQSTNLDDIVALIPEIKSVQQIKDLFQWKSYTRQQELLAPKLRVKHHVTVKFICNRGFTHELVRHRGYKFPDEQVIKAKYSQESTRYCNYSSEAFGSEISVIRPVWLDEDIKTEHLINKEKLNRLREWEVSCNQAETSYFSMIQNGAKPDDARDMLPIGLKTEIICTTTLAHWEHIFNLRCAKAAHPSMRQLMIPLRKEFIKRGYIV